MKEQLLKILYEHQGQPVSGETLGERLGVSRSYIWKLTEQLKEEGVPLTSVPRKGYCLPQHHNDLFAFEIQGFAKGDYAITVLPETDSTNRVVKTLAEEGAPEGTAVFAKSQTAGYGRQGRAFFSPKGTGLYFSVLLRPEKGMADASKITVTAAVAVAQAVEEILGISLSIKWVNDLYYHNKKVCGILSQGAVDLEGGGLAYCVLGIGLNVFTPKGGFGSLSPIAGALLDEEPNGSLLARLGATVLDRFFALYQQAEFAPCLEEYRSRSFLTGKEVTILRGADRFAGKVLGIDDTGALLVEQKGKTLAFSSGEIALENYR
ncbi:MAG: biotin--[Clostridia bacterium]|nr:biotin--[acetyl-CoA-carboxylase] ligase [Clostridia bacterium]